jgi:threonine/homoserine/homoserine lactone efflux protein
MISALAAGFVFGLSSGLAPGPLLTLVITQTLKHGVMEGIKVASAPLITDLPIILVSFVLLTRVADFRAALGIVSLVGGGYVLYLAYECFKTKPIGLGGSLEQPKSIRKGTLINFLNPHPYLFWVTVGTPYILKLKQESFVAPLLFIVSFYGLLVGSKAALVVIVGRSRTFLMSRGYLAVLRILAGLLGLFALFLIRDGLNLLGVFG